MLCCLSMGKILTIFVALLAALVGTVLVDRPTPDADLTILNPVSFITLDPQRMAYHQDLQLNYTIYETLLRWDNMDPAFSPIPAAARRWERSDDGLVYTFHLDPKGAWSNGAPLTAEHFRYAWKRAMMPELAADYSNLFFVIRGAQAFFDWRNDQLEAYAERPAGERNAAAARELREAADRRFDETVGIEAVDDLTLRVTLERPTAYFADLCCFGPFAPVYPPLLEDHLRIDASTGRIQMDYSWTKPPRIVTNGPYVPSVWRFKREMLLERNPYFRDPTMGKSETIKIIPIVDLNTSVLAYETGAADLHSDVRVDYIPEMLRPEEEGGRDELHSISTFGTYFWGFNCTPRLADGRDNPFHDARVRRAFVLAVDKRTIVDNVRRTGEKVATTFVPPGSIGGFDTPRGLQYDPDRAREELASAGWADRDGDGTLENERGLEFPVVELLYSTAGYHKDIALVLARMWEEELGVQTRLEGKETKVYKDDLKKKNYMVARGGWFGDYGDPTTFHSLHRTGDGNNDRGYSNEHFDSMLEAAEREADPEKRMEILEECERFLMDEELPILPIFHYDWYFLYKPPFDERGRPIPGGLLGMSPHPRNVKYYWQLEYVTEEDAARWDAANGADARGGG